VKAILASEKLVLEIIIGARGEQTALADPRRTELLRKRRISLLRT